MKFKFLKDDEIIYDLNNLKYIEKDNKITFMVEKNKCIFEIFKDGCIFLREDSDYKFKLDTIKKECTLELKGLNLKYDIKIFSLDYKNIDNKIILKYNIETDEKTNIIEINRGE